MVEQAEVKSAQLSQPPLVKDPFERFAGLPFYVEENRRLIGSLGLTEGQRLLDLACGPGNIAKLAAEKLGPSGEITAVDMSRRALAAARENLSGIETSVQFIQARAEDISNVINNLKGKFNSVVCGNSIHNFADKKGVIAGVGSLLLKGGGFAFNTAFFTGATTQDQDKSFYRPWVFSAMRKASKMLQERNLSQEPQESEKVEARKDWSIDDYIEKLGELGFKVRVLGVRAMRLSLEAFEAISEDHEFVKGAMPKFPYEIARDALQRAIKELFAQKGLDYSERKWLLIAAYKNF